MGTLLFALLGGIGRFVPHFAAQLAILTVLRSPVGHLWTRVRFELRLPRLAPAREPAQGGPATVPRRRSRWYH